MVGAIRYRQGTHAETGAPLIGAAHLAQSLSEIWMTNINQMPMLLEFGSNLRGKLSEDITPALALAIYNELATTAARWEPEYGIAELQLVRLTQDGALGLRHGGFYYPEGRFGNFETVEQFSDLRRSFGMVAA